jgi:hypothetical protein
MDTKKALAYEIDLSTLHWQGMQKFLYSSTTALDDKTMADVTRSQLLFMGGIAFEKFSFLKEYGTVVRIPPTPAAISMWLGV